MFGKIFGKGTPPPPNEYYGCLRCDVFSTTSKEKFKQHVENCEPQKGDGNAAFLGAMTDEDVAEIPKAARRKFLGLEFLK